MAHTIKKGANRSKKRASQNRALDKRRVVGPCPEYVLPPQLREKRKWTIDDEILFIEVFEEWFDRAAKAAGWA